MARLTSLRLLAARLVVIATALVACLFSNGLALASTTGFTNSFSTTDSQTQLTWSAQGSLTYSSWIVSGGLLAY